MDVEVARIEAKPRLCGRCGIGVVPLRHESTSHDVDADHNVASGIFPVSPYGVISGIGPNTAWNGGFAPVPVKSESLGFGTCWPLTVHLRCARICRPQIPVTGVFLDYQSKGSARIPHKTKSSAISTFFSFSPIPDCARQISIAVFDHSSVFSHVARNQSLTAALTFQSPIQGRSPLRCPLAF